jgi:bifunctional ADP-heptose synthase (sugar kinase/adenylyltransferase)
LSFLLALLAAALVVGVCIDLYLVVSGRWWSPFPIPLVPINSRHVRLQGAGNLLLAIGACGMLVPLLGVRTDSLVLGVALMAAVACTAGLALQFQVKRREHDRNL